MIYKALENSVVYRVLFLHSQIQKKKCADKIKTVNKAEECMIRDKYISISNLKSP